MRIDTQRFSIDVGHEPDVYLHVHQYDSLGILAWRPIRDAAPDSLVNLFVLVDTRHSHGWVIVCPRTALLEIVDDMMRGVDEYILYNVGPSGVSEIDRSSMREEASDAVA